MNTVSTSEGFLYVATGDQYLEEAKRSLSYLRVSCPEAKACLITDRAVANTEFDTVKRVDFNQINDKSWKANLVYKIVGIMNSPFEKTIYLDTDTFVIHPIIDLFNLLNYFDLLHCLDHYDRSLIEGIRVDLKSYTPYNTGVLAFRKTKMVERFFEDWKNLYEENINAYWSDQPAFMHALLNHPIKTYALPTNYNFRFLNNVGFLEKEKVKIIHGRASDEDIQIISNRINKNLGNRVWVASRRRCYGWTENNWISLSKRIYALLPNSIQSIFRMFWLK